MKRFPNCCKMQVSRHDTLPPSGRSCVVSRVFRLQRGCGLLHTLTCHPGVGKGTNPGIAHALTALLVHRNGHLEDHHTSAGHPQCHNLALIDKIAWQSGPGEEKSLDLYVSVPPRAGGCQARSTPRHVISPRDTVIGGDDELAMTVLHVYKTARSER